ncbi:MAG: ABC transporter ATP-binding protein, partial [Candidatus Ranarchaeia archaeon]
MVSEKKKEKESAGRWLLGKIFERKSIFLVMFLGVLVSTQLKLFLPLIIGTVIDDILLNTGNHTVDTQISAIFQYATLFLIVGCVAAAIELLQRAANEVLAWHTETSIREEFYLSIQSKPISFHDKSKTGNIMALATNDTRMINVMISPGINLILGLVITSLGIVSTVLRSSITPLLLLTLIPFIPMYIFSLKSYSDKLAPIAKTFQRKFANIANTVQDNVEGVRIVRAFGGEEFEQKDFLNIVNDFKNTWIIRQKAAARYYPSFTLFLAMGAIFVVGIFLIDNGLLTVGELVAFNGILGTLMVPTFVISFAIMQVQSGYAGALRIFNIINEEEEEESEKEKKERIDFPKEIHGEIHFNNITFAYPDDPKNPVLKNIDFKVKPGEVVALVGPTGSGKSTLTKLLLRLYDLENDNFEPGKITIDDVDISKFRLESLRKNI